MIILKEMTWSNWFSYGNNNTLDFSSNTLTQVLGVNGSGKSSIPLILEELLFGKNSKGVKKQDITNRYTGSKIREAGLTFNVDNDNYELKLRRNANTTKLTLIRNDNDISSHTSTGTYKQLEKIIGIDFKTFNQLVYQSSKASLEFLTATDTQRKNFLIALLGLDKYAEIYIIFKDQYRATSKIVSELEGSCATIESWINKHSKEDMGMIELMSKSNESDEEWRKDLSQLNHEKDNIAEINKKRNANNQYKKLLKAIDMSALSEIVEKPEPIQNKVSHRDHLNKKIKEITAKAKKLQSLKEAECPTCHQEVDTDLVKSIIDTWRSEVKKYSLESSELDKAVGQHREIQQKYKRHTDATQEFERLSLLADFNVPEEILDMDSIRFRIMDAQKRIDKIAQKKQIISRHNKNAEEHNSKIQFVSNQLVEYQRQLSLENERLQDSSQLLLAFDILRQSFSTNGLVSYKIEYLVKDLEEGINEYLSEFSAGRFQLSFALKGEKLNIEIIDNGNVIDITALSSGELARVNISTLLAIRKMMSSISSTKINLLFLDEIMGVLDSYGKDKLIEVLLEEQDLNTYLVSHEYTHPLLEKVTITKEGDISKVEHG